MNKYKKIASLVVATVMAGSMVASLAACTPDNNVPTGGGQAVLTPKLDENNKLTYSDNTKVQLALGYNNENTGITYSAGNITTLGATTKLMGKAHTAKELKPAWAALESKLKIGIEDKYDGSKAGDNISNISNNSSIGGLSGVSLLTASAATINDASANGSLLNIADYLDYMPNYKAFLESNDIIYASLISDKKGSMYMLPYFDGNDDIEKFVLLRKDLTSRLLDSANLADNAAKFSTFKSQADAKNGATTPPVKAVVATAASVESFMGTKKEDNYSVDVTNPALYTYTGTYGDAQRKEGATGAETVKVYICYDKALEAAKASDSALNTALKAVNGVDDAAINALTSGNIVDLQNLAINKSQGQVTGLQLLNILNAYIDVAYCTTENGGTPFYAADNNGLKRSDVFNSASAAWDVDLYVALGRCFVTSGTYLGSEVKGEAFLYLLSARNYTTQRTNDIISLAGELYGVRGLESRYNYSYIDTDGSIKDARETEGIYKAAERIHAMALEGLFNTSNNIKKDHVAINSNANTGVQTLSHHDYVQTQTKDGFDNPGWNFAPVLTPVSRWNDGKGEKVMRFTESWRGVKDGGIAVSYANVKNDPNKLSAVLAFIDYMYSKDGQILLTYGPRSAKGNVAEPDGLWYATASTQYTLADVAEVDVPATNYAEAQYTVKEAYAQKCFVYEGVVYEGELYIDRNIPILTDENLGIFHMQEKNSFTNHARELLGTCLPLGNKDQGFEYQCTSDCGKVGSRIFNIALANGTVKHQYQTLDGTTGKLDASGNKVYVGGGSASSPNYWYTLAPTQLPYTKLQTNALGAATGTLRALSGVGGAGANLYINEDKEGTNLLVDITYRGYDTEFSLTSLALVNVANKLMPANAAGCIALNNSLDMATLMKYKRDGWKIIQDWFAAKNA